jgi:GrpB-like predicted nucleotidyltransferase (UPF0157 family)
MAYDDKIGLRRGTVKVVAHHPKWAEYFGKERQLLFKVMGQKVLDIRHVGSTSIPGMPAKPIVDILAAVRTLDDVEPFTENLIRAGYEDRGNGDVLGRRYFVKGGEDKRTHHLNFCEMNSFFWTSHLAFRDYLEQHTEAAKQYSALKRALAARFPNDRHAYTTGKEEFVRSIVKLAMNEPPS